MDIQRQNKTTMLFISHDLSVVRYIADRVVVMYLGHIVEQGTTDQIFSPPYHPYTEALLSAIPIADTSVVKKHIVLEGDIPSAMNPPSGCPFQTRCRYKSLVPGGLCDIEVPPVRTLAGGHQVKCHLSDEVFAKMEPVISFAKDEDDASGHGTPGAGPGFVGKPPRRPRGKTASPEASADGEGFEEVGGIVAAAPRGSSRRPFRDRRTRSGRARGPAGRLGQPDRRRRCAVAVRRRRSTNAPKTRQRRSAERWTLALAGRDARQARSWHRVRQRAAADSGRPPPARRTRGGGQDCVAGSFGCRRGLRGGGSVGAAAPRRSPRRPLRDRRARHRRVRRPACKSAGAA